MTRQIMAGLVPIFLLAVALYHAIRPKVLELDWQTVTLLVFAVFLLFMPVRDFAGMIKTLQIGKLKIMLEEAEELSDSVDSAEASEEAEGPVQADAVALGEKVEKGKEEKEEGEEQDDEGEGDEDGGSGIANRRPPRSPRTGPTRFAVPERMKGEDTRVDGILRLFEEMNRLLSVDSRAALIRLASYIEFAVITLASHALPGHNVRTFNEAIRALFAQGWITSDTGDALRQFMRVRNNVVHLGSGSEVSDEIVRRSMNDGWRLVKLLHEIGARHGDDPLTGESAPILS